MSATLPRLSAAAPDSPLTTHLLTELRMRGFEGDLSGGAADRLSLVTDNSIYQVLPGAVACRACRC